MHHKLKDIMVNVIIYLEKISHPDELVNYLLKQGLASSASIDTDNGYYILANKEVIQKTHTVITLQTKSLLFSHIAEYIASKYGDEIPIYSLPLTQSNNYFDQFIRSGTKKI